MSVSQCKSFTVPSPRPVKILSLSVSVHCGIRSNTTTGVEISVFQCTMVSGPTPVQVLDSQCFNALWYEVQHQFRCWNLSAFVHCGIRSNTSTGVGISVFQCTMVSGPTPVQVLESLFQCTMVSGPTPVQVLKSQCFNALWYQVPHQYRCWNFSVSMQCGIGSSTSTGVGILVSQCTMVSGPTPVQVLES